MSQSDKKENHTNEIPETRQTFPLKLYEAVNDYHDLIQWSADGLRILINEKRFENEISSTYPCLVQIRSFVNFRRQLREYNFSWAVGNGHDFEFCHPLFRRDQPDLVRSILTRRKSKQVGIMPEAYTDQENPLSAGRKRMRRTAVKHGQNDKSACWDIPKTRAIDKANVLPRASTSFITVDDQSTTELDLQSTMAGNDQIHAQLDVPLSYYEGGAGDTSVNATTQIMNHANTGKDINVDSCLQLGCNGPCGYNSFRMNSSTMHRPQALDEITQLFPATIPYYPNDGISPRYPCTQACGMPRDGTLPKGNWSPYPRPVLHRSSLPPFPDQFRPKSSVAPTTSSGATSLTDAHPQSSITDTALYDHNTFSDEHSRALYSQGYIPIMYTWIPGNPQPHTAGNHGDTGSTSYPEIDDEIDSRAPSHVDSNNNGTAVPTATHKLQAIDNYCQTSPLVLD